MESESDKKGPTRALLCCQESGAIRRAEACLRRLRQRAAKLPPTLSLPDYANQRGGGCVPLPHGGIQHVFCRFLLSWKRMGAIMTAESDKGNVCPNYEVTYDDNG